MTGVTLVNSANFSDQLTNDVVQISFGSPNYLGGQFPLAQVMALPFIFDTSEEPSAIDKAKFQNLPPAVQKVLTDNSGDPASWRLGYLLDQLQDEEPKRLNTLADQNGITAAEQHAGRYRADQGARACSGGEGRALNAIAVRRRSFVGNNSREGRLPCSTTPTAFAPRMWVGCLRPKISPTCPHGSPART